MKHTACMMLSIALVISEPARSDTPNQRFQWEVMNRFTLFEDVDIEDSKSRAKGSAQLFSEYLCRILNFPAPLIQMLEDGKKGHLFEMVSPSKGLGGMTAGAHTKPGFTTLQSTSF